MIQMNLQPLKIKQPPKKGTLPPLHKDPLYCRRP